MPEDGFSANASLIEDRRLIDRMNRGKPEAADAFEALYRKYRDWALRTAWRFTHDAHTAGEVTQDAFLHVLMRFPPHSRPFELQCRFTTYLYPVIRSIALTRHRRDRSHADAIPHMRQAAAARSRDTPTTHGGPGPELSAALQDLSLGQREAVILKYVDGLTIEEISLAMDIPAGTVKSRLHQGIARLRADPRTKNLFEQ